MEGITYMYVFCNLINMLEIRLASKQSSSIVHKWAMCLGNPSVLPNSEGGIQAGTWNHQNHQHVHLLQRPSGGHVSWGCWWETWQGGWPSAIKHPSRTAPLTQSQRCLCAGYGETQLRTTHWRIFTHPLTSFALYMVILFIVHNILCVYME